MKKIIVLLSAVLLSFILPLSALAYDSAYLIDDADLLTEYEEEIIADHLDHLRDNHNMDFVIHTTPDTYGKDIASYCDDYYDNGAYSEDGLIFVISMAQRDYFTSTCGVLIDTLDYYTLETLCSPAVDYLSDGDYYNAFETYLDNIDSYLANNLYADANGNYYGTDSTYTDNDYYYTDDFNYTTDGSSISDSLLAKEIILIVTAVVIALIITMVLKSKMNTAIAKRDADDYVVKGSFKLEGSRDMFVGSHTSRRALPQNNNNNRSGGGSGGVRVSSGGVRHGGGGGKF